MPTLSSIHAEAQGFAKFNDLPWFSEAANHKGLAKGGIYLLSGPPGGGKTTLSLQMAIDLACQGHKVLYVALEQTPYALKEWVENRIFPHRHANAYADAGDKLGWKEDLQKVKERLDVESEEQRIEHNFFIDSSVSGMEALPDFLTRQVIGSNVQYAGSECIFVDSIQGLGTAPTSSKPYQRLFEFNRWAKEHGITVVLVGHTTKGGAIAGPRSLEHNVDCVLYMRKAMRFRPLFVPKNRFGPERHEPFSLITDKTWGCLEKSKHIKAKASRAFGYLPGNPDLIEVQALVKLPKYGDHPGIKAPYLPRQKLSQLIGIVSSLKDIDISDLTFEINCAIPGGRPYSQTLDLPLVVSMLASYFQTEIPVKSLFIGEVDLTQEVRQLPQAQCEVLVELLASSQPADASHLVKTIFISDRNSKDLGKSFAAKGSPVEVCGVSNLESLVRTIWPEAIQES